MKIDKSMIEPELQRLYYPLKVPFWLMTKRWGISLLNKLGRSSEGNCVDSLECEEHMVASNHGGSDIRVRVFKPKGVSSSLPALFYVHGGGYIMGNPEVALMEIEEYIRRRPCVVIAPAYRLADKHPYPAGFNDCHDTLLWMRDNAESLGITPNQYCIGGHSAGGGMTAALTLKMRETKEVTFAFQMPIYPMIDHRQATDSATDNNVMGWNSKNSKAAWDLYLRDVSGQVPIYASPSLNQDYKGLPPTISFVGDLEPFKDETIDYMKQLEAAGVPVKFQLFEGAFHAFEYFCPEAAISKKASAFHRDAFAEYFDKYFV